MEKLNVTSKKDTQVIQENSDININQNDYTLTTQYHQSEIEQNKMIMLNAVIMIWVGILILFIGLILTVKTDIGWLSLLPGAFVDLFSGTMIYLVNKSSEHKQKYFEKLTTVEHEERIIELINQIESKEFKEAMIAKIVDRHCKD